MQKLGSSLFLLHWSLDLTPEDQAMDGAAALAVSSFPRLGDPAEPIFAP
jgi:hypothetical protein